MRLNTNKVFVSVYQASVSNEINHANHLKAIELLDQNLTQYQVVKGVYKGNEELTFLLASASNEDHEFNLNIAYGLAQSFDQESVLEVHNDGRSVLRFTNPGDYSAFEDKYLGEFTEVLESEALQGNNYTFEPISGRYFVVK